MKELRDYCFYTPIVVLILSIILSVVLMVIVGVTGDLLPDWFQPKPGLIFYAMLFENAMFSIFSCTVILNTFKFVRDSICLSFITFFWPVIFFYIAILLNLDHPDAGFSLLIPLAFVIPQGYSFFIFHKRLKSGYFDEDL